MSSAPHKTPVKAMSASGPLLANLSTPYHRGSGANTSQATAHKVPEYQIYIAQDLSMKKNVSVEQFFEHILGTKLNDFPSV